MRVDGDGELRCWNCGSKGLIAKRTFRSKMLVGVGALLTKKKLKCQTCDEYNDTGNADPFTGPEARKWRKAWEKEQDKKSKAQRESEARAAVLAAKALVSEVARAQASGIAFDDDGNEISAQRPTPSLSSGPPPPPPALTVAVPPVWQSDPSGRHELRYWDGTRWTEHVSDAGVVAVDTLT